jgi:2-keto-3-deoxy-galactonokinase
VFIFFILSQSAEWLIQPRTACPPIFPGSHGKFASILHKNIFLRKAHFLAELFERNELIARSSACPQQGERHGHKDQAA